MIIANPINFLVKMIDLMHNFINFNFEKFLLQEKNIGFVRNFVSDTRNKKKKRRLIFLDN